MELGDGVAGIFQQQLANPSRAVLEFIRPADLVGESVCEEKELVARVIADLLVGKGLFRFFSVFQSADGLADTSPSSPPAPSQPPSASWTG